MDMDSQNNKLPRPIDDLSTGLHNTIPGAPSFPTNPIVTDNNNPSFNLNNPSLAQDDDLIEKEWIERVEHIVHTYKEDPFNQVKALNTLKVDYIKKRYNKIIQDGE